MSLEQLAERCEAAKGPDIQLDADIRDALGLPHDYAAEWRGWGFNANGAPIEKAKAFPYSKSIDAAMQLVPEGHIFLLTNTSVDRPGPVLSLATALVGEANASEEKAAMVTAITPALALCAAALRAQAHAALEQSK